MDGNNIEESRYACPCGIYVKNTTQALHQHFKTATHKYFLDTGEAVSRVEVDETYPTGHWRRSIVARKRAMKKYHARKRLEAISKAKLINEDAIERCEVTNSSSQE